MNAIAYHRVSTRRQAQSGLGLEAQVEAVQTFCRNSGRELIASYQEVESGKRKDRPELLNAIQHAKHSQAVLVVARMDRLARNVSFLSSLMESGIEFVACDNPSANRLTVHILAAIAEHEAKLISQRTKAALDAAKQRGVRLGSSRIGHWQGREHVRLVGLKNARQRSKEVRTAKAREFSEFLVPRVLEARDGGSTYAQIAAMLNNQKMRTRRGKAWTAAGVWRLCKKLESAGMPNSPARQISEPDS